MRASLLLVPLLADRATDRAEAAQLGGGMGSICGVLAAIVVLIVLVVTVIKLIQMFQYTKREVTHSMRRDLGVPDPDGPRRRRKVEVVFRGEKVPEWKIAPRAKATKNVLKFLSERDQWFERKYLTEVAEEAVIVVREATERRSVERVADRLTSEYRDEFGAVVKRLRQEHERHVFEKVVISDVQIVHVEASGEKADHTYTALVDVKSRDYFEDDETGKLVRGDHKVYTCQEFWTFRRSSERWLVELVRPSADLDAVLEAKTVLTAADLATFKADASPATLEHVREVVVSGQWSVVSRDAKRSE